MCKLLKPYPPKTATQVANQERFAKANAFAKEAIADPVRKAQYQKRAQNGQSAYNVAFSDAFHGAEISEVNVSGKAVTVKMKNDHSVKEVLIDGEPAVFNKKKEVWEYPVKKKARRVEAYDLMGNGIHQGPYLIFPPINSLTLRYVKCKNFKKGKDRTE